MDDSRLDFDHPSRRAKEEDQSETFGLEIPVQR
jgi:hypothetical protein